MTGRREDVGHEGSVARAVALLRAFAEGGEILSIKEISHQLQLPASSVHRLLESLVDLNMIERAPRRRYRVGVEFSRIGALAARKVGVVRLATPVMQRVVQATSETCLLGILLPAVRQMAIVEKADSPHPLRYRVRMHQKRSLLWGATGRGILAWLDDGEVGKVLESAAPSTSGERVPSATRLSSMLADIRRRGYVLTRGQQTPGAVGIAAPVFGADGRVLGDLCLTIPEMRFRGKDETRFAAVLVEEARRLCALLGHQPSL